MLKKITLLSAAALLAFAAAGCSAKKTAAEEQAAKEKVWRAQQRTKAIQYYNQIVEKFPDSEYSAQAKERLNALGAQPGSKGAGEGAAKATAKK